MFPIGDDNSARRATPVVTYALIAINLVVFFLELQRGNAFITEWAFIPARFTDDPSGDAVTLLSAMFMHGGWMHLGGNMLYLWIFGDNVEDRMGHLKYLIFYLLCGVLASAAHIFFGPNSMIPSLGASGAIAGVLGAYLVLFPRQSVRVFQWGRIIEVPALIVIGLWGLLQFISGFGSLSNIGQSGGVAYMAHVGGFVAGILLQFLFRNPAPPPRFKREPEYW